MLVRKDIRLDTGATASVHARRQQELTPTRNLQSEAYGKNCKQQKRLLSKHHLHVALVANSNRWVDLKVTLASLLQARSCQLTVHLICEDNLREKASDFTGTEEQDLFHLAFYSMPKYSLEGLNFFPEAHQKLFLDSILPEDVERVLLIDSDLMVVGDICSANTVFFHMRGATFALAPEMSYWYDGHKLGDGLSNPANATDAIVGHNFYAHTFWGFNSGVVFWDLSQARHRKWSQELSQVLKASMSKHNVTSMPMGDQDVYNVICVDHPGLCAVVSNDWNFQLIEVKRDTPHLSHSIIIYHGNSRYFTDKGSEDDNPMVGVWRAFSKDDSLLELEDCQKRWQSRDIFELARSV